jgi:hypothetical protein
MIGAMKKIVPLISIVVLVSACAGMDYRYQENMATNAAGWGLLGAGAGAAIASATHKDVGQAATLGAVAGAALGAANTPPPSPAYSPVISQPQPPVPQYQPSAVYAPPPVYYASPPVVYAPAPILYAPPPYYRDYYNPFYGLGGINIAYYDGDKGHCYKNGGSYYHGYRSGYSNGGKYYGNYRHRHGNNYSNNKGYRYFRKRH